MKKLTKCLWLLVPLQYQLLTSMHLCPYRAVLYDQLTEKEKDGIWFTDGSTIYISIKQKVTAEALTNPFCHNPERHRQRETFTVGKTLDIMQGHIFCLEGLRARCVIFHWFMCGHKLDWLGHWGLENSMIGKQVRKTSREEVCGWIPANGQTV